MLTRLRNQSTTFGILLLTTSAGSTFAALLYVDAGTTNAAPPYLTWATAAATIQQAVDAAAPGDEIMVTNGLYAAGGRALGTNVLLNRVSVDKPLILRSVNGPSVTVIKGYKMPTGFLGCGDAAIRCVALATGATITGFTLSNGATRIEGDLLREQSGGGVWCESGGAVVSNCVITFNGAWFGGGASGGFFSNCILTNNSARTNGGAAYASTLNNCTITRNSSRFGDGGGVHVCKLNHCTLTSNLTLNGSGGGASDSMLDHCTLIGNAAAWAGGGACSGTLNHCTLTNNSAGVGGGAFYAALTNCTLVANSAGSGGGTYAGTLNHCTLMANYATRTNWWTGGGGAGGGTLVNCLLDHNNSAGYGGGVTGNLGMEGSPEAFLVNCVLTGNSAQLGGGAYWGTLHNCTLTDNSAWTGGGANGSNLRNCIIYFNSATNSANSTQAPYGPLNYCCTWPMPTSGVGNFTNAPLFVDYSGGNFRLQSNSPCINAGLNLPDPGRTDMDGLPRLISGTVDIGAYEYQGAGSLISYAWLQRFGLPIDGSADSADPDADGHSNWHEWRSQTDPTNTLSALRLLSAAPAGSHVSVTWQSVPGVRYFLQRGTNLPANPAFAMLATNLPGQSNSTSYVDTNPANAPLGFYRVGVAN